MAATLVSSPATPASCYRPLVYRTFRTDPAGTLLDEVFIADSADVSALGNGLEVGDVVMLYTGSIAGGIPVVAGQTVILDSLCGPYAGVQMVTNAFDDGGDHYAVIDALDQGDYTPTGGSFKAWLNNYTFHLRVLIYPDPTGSPLTVDLRAQPNQNGVALFHVNNVIKDYFSHRIDTFMGPVAGGGIIQNAHGVTSLFYRVHIAEVYDVPGVTTVPDPFDGDHDVHVDDVEDVATFRVAVNGAHPYAGNLLDWATADMADFVVGDTDYSSRVLSHMPMADVLTQSGLKPGRKITLGTDDHFGIFLLTDSALDYEVDYRLRIYDLSGTPGIHTDIAFDLDDLTSSFCVRIGPADIAASITGLTKYSVWLRSDSSNFHCEPIEVTIDPKCKEVKRSIAWLNHLGGVDQFTFTGREQYSSNVKRFGLRKNYASGTGFDFRSRTYRTEVERIRTVHSAPVNRDTRKWIGEGIGESANVMVMEAGRACTAELLTGEIPTYTTGPSLKAVSIEYRLGVDNLTQQA